MHLHGHFWELVSFTIFVLLLIKPLKNAISQYLKDYSNSIRTKFEEAKTLRIEAEAFLADYKQAHIKFTAKSEQIIKNTDENIAILSKQASEKLEEQLETKKRLHKEKLVISQKDKLMELKTDAIYRALKIVKLYLQDHASDNISASDISETLSMIKPANIRYN